MSRPPRDPKRPLLTLALLMRTVLVSLILIAGGFWLFFWELRAEGASVAAARTTVINVIVLVEIAYLFSCRSLKYSIFSIGWFTNWWVIAGSLAMLSAQILFTYVPVMNKLFHSAPIGAESWMRIVGIAVLAFVMVEFEKWLRFGRARCVEKKTEQHGEASLSVEMPSSSQSKAILADLPLAAKAPAPADAKQRDA